MNRKEVLSSDIKTLRLLGVTAALLVFFSGLVYKFILPDEYNPWWERIVIIIFALAPVALTYVNEFFRKNADYLFYPFYFLILFWIIQLAHYNHLSAEQASAVLLLIASSGLMVFRRIWHLGILLVYTLALALASVLTVASPLMIPYAYMTLVVAGCVLAFVMYGSKTRLYYEVFEGKDLLEKYLNVVGVMIVVLDKDGRVVMANNEVERVLGYAQKDLLNKNWFAEFIPDEDKEKTRQVFDQLISGNTEFVKRNENLVLTAQGRKRLIAWNNAVLKNDKGQIWATLSSGEDITEKRVAEGKIKKLNESMVGRELAMVVLKKQNEELKSKLDSIMKKMS